MASKHTEYEKRTEELLVPIAEASGVEIYDVEYVREGPDYHLRAYIDKPGGVNIGDCETVSRALSDALDEADFIPDAYILEVSSPGLGRALTKDRHLERSIGQEIEIKLYKPLEGTKVKQLSGILDGFDTGTISIELDEDTTRELHFGEQLLQIERSKIAQVRLALDF